MAVGMMMMTRVTMKWKMKLDCTLFNPWPALRSGERLLESSEIVILLNSLSSCCVTIKFT